MIRNKLQKVLRDRGGMTLVEILTSFAIVVICTAVLVVTFGSAVNLMKLGSSLTENGDAAFANIESGSSVTSSGQLTFTAGGAAFSVSGTYCTGTSGSKIPVTYMEFRAAD